VRQVQDTALAVVELAEEEHQPVDEEADVGGAHQEAHAGRQAQRQPHPLEELLGRGEVLEHVQQQHVVVGAEIERRQLAL
jgi:hypothetical protein